MNPQTIYRAIMISTLFLATSLFPQQRGEIIQGTPGQSLGREIVSKRTLTSKTYLNAASNTFTTVASTGFLHYADQYGRMRDINRNIVRNADSTAYEVRRGLYIAEFPLEMSDKAATGPEPFDAAQDKLRRRMVSFQTRDGFFFDAVPVELAYFDRQSKQLVSIEKAQRSVAVTEGNKIRYPNVFTGVDVEYEYLDKRLKQKLFLSQQARDRLPGLPRGLTAVNTDLVVVSRFVVSDDLEAFVGEEKKSSVGADSKVRVDHEGEEGVEFRHNGQDRFRLHRDVAFPEARADSVHSPMWRRFYHEQEQNFVLSGVALRWLQAQAAGTIVLDPTVTLAGASDDSWINSNATSTSYGSSTEMNIGKYFSKRRALVKFDLGNIPQDATITSAEMKIYYFGRFGTNVNRTVQAHRVLVLWTESLVTWDASQWGGAYWNVPGVGLDNVDASSTAEDSELFDATTGWETFDLTSLTQDWVDGTATNYGVVLWATNETTGIEAKRIYSSEYSGDTSKRPQMVISYTVDPLAEYRYDAQSRPDTVIFANGVQEVNDYDDDRGWIKRRDYKDGGSNVFYFNNSGIDAVGNITEQKYKHGTSSEKDMDYAYDNLHRLKTFKFGGTTERTYTYDDNGNFDQFDGTSFTYGNDNNQLTSDGTRSYTFDESGRVKQIASTAMTYDIFNNMLTYGNDSYSYDDANQRLRKIESSDTTFYIRNGLNTLAEYDGSGDLLGEYIHDDRGLIAKFDSTEGHFWYITDHLGSTRRLESSSMQRDYYPFGEDYTAAGSETDYQFTGKELDSGSGLYYFGARYYDRRIGRWLTVDPLAHQFPTWTPYNYVYNNPLRYNDPSGLATDDSTGATTNKALVEKVPWYVLLAQRAKQGVKITGSGALSALGMATTLLGLQGDHSPEEQKAFEERKKNQTKGTTEGASQYPNETEDSSEQFVVRLQAQGSGLQASEPIARSQPVTAMEAHAALGTLQGRLTRSQLRVRNQAFAAAGRWIDAVASKGGIGPGVKKTFTNPGVKGSVARVDVEILRGSVNLVR